MRTWLLFLCTVLLLPARVALAEEARELAWNELSLVIGKNLRILMPDGSRIEGRAISIEPDVFVIRVRKTADPAKYPKGNLSVSRASLKTFQMSTPTIRWRVLGTSVGAALGLVAGVLAACGASECLGPPVNGKSNKAAIAVLAGVAVALPVGGYFLGNRADRRWTTVRVGP